MNFSDIDAQDPDIWEDESMRAMAVLGQTTPSVKRQIEDKVMLTFTNDQWRKLFNMGPEFKPCGSDYEAYREQAPVRIYFIRKVVAERA